MNKLNNAFTFGKFLPFHHGHKALIEFALTQCQQLTIIVCASDQETIDVQQRCQWITQTFNHQPVTIIPFTYNEQDLINTSTSSEHVSKQWANAFAPLIQHCQTVITSEPYGDYVANYLNIKHIAFDKTRLQIPISATTINQAPTHHWNYLPNSVKQDLAFSVVLLGTESTGKTTLCQSLSAHYQATPVYEIGRELVADSRDFNHQLLPIIAEQHAQRIINAKQAEHPLIIIDTDIHITASYAEFCFNHPLTITPHVAEANKANLYLYLENDAPFIQDGTRMEHQQRNLLDRSHKKILQQHHIPYISIRGNWQERFNQACKQIDQATSTYFPWCFRK